MTQNELIAIQTPIKERYKRHPNEAAASISATACLKPDIKNMLTTACRVIPIPSEPVSREGA